MPELTERQEQVIEFYRKHKAEHGFPPTIRQVAEWVGVASPGHMQRILDTTPGIIRRRDGERNRYDIDE